MSAPKVIKYHWILLIKLVERKLMQPLNSSSILTKIFTKVLLYAAVFAAAYYAAFIDASDGKILVGNSVENYQEGLLVLMAILSGYAAWRIPALRVVMVCLAGLAAASFFRELNNQLEAIFHKGFWIIPVVLVLIPTVIYAARNFKTLLRQVDSILDSFAFGVYFTGFLVLHVFSRLFGANDIWKLAMKENFIRDVARTAEETTELLGYSIMFLGTIELYRYGVSKLSSKLD